MKQQSLFIGEILDRRGQRGADGRSNGQSGAGPGALDTDEQVAAVHRVMPLPTARERRLALRLRASELVGLMEATSAADPETTVRPR